MIVDRIEHLTQMVRPLATSLGLVLWGVEVVGASRPVARIYVDADPDAAPVSAAPVTEAGEVEAFMDDTSGVMPDVMPDVAQGVTIDQCAHLSRLLGLSLDVEEPFSANWVLEVSSPGLERPFFFIEQLRGYEGRTLDVVMTEAHDEWNGRKKFCGRLDIVEDESFTLTPTARTVDDPEDVRIFWHMVRKAHLVHEFEEPAARAERGGQKKSGRRPARKQPKPGDALE